jgi:hypothetical protein
MEAYVSNPSFNKRQKERQRKEKQQEKAAKRAERKRQRDVPGAPPTSEIELGPASPGVVPAASDG